MKHTPGPWFVVTRDAGFIIDSQSTKDTANGRIANVQQFSYKWAGPMREEAQANAQLIAAAPDLLAACIKTVEENGHLADGDNCTLIHLVKAIAKATGEQE